MTRRAVAFDRMATFIAGLCLAGLGCLVVAWQRGVFGPNTAVRVPFADDLESGWWPWASGAAGIALIVLGLRWLAAHRWRRKVSRVALVTRDRDLTADACSVAQAAGAALEAEVGVLKGSGTATLERGCPTVGLTVTVPARRGLGAAVTAADRTARTVAVMLPDGVAVRSVVRVDAKHGRVVR